MSTLNEVETLDLLAKHKVLRTSELLQQGVHPRILYALRDSGRIQQLGRGLYILSDHSPLAHPDFVIVASKVPQAVICLISALAYHELTTQIPHTVSIALPAFSHPPRLAYPPLSVYRFSEPALSAGVEIHVLDEVQVRIYTAEKSIADLFKFRHRLGLDVALEALKSYLARPTRDVNQLLHYAAICRVTKVIQPYLEALL